MSKTTKQLFDELDAALAELDRAKANNDTVGHSEEQKIQELEMKFDDEVAACRARQAAAATAYSEAHRKAVELQQEFNKRTSGLLSESAPGVKVSD